MVTSTRSFLPFRKTPKRASGVGETLAFEKALVWRGRDTTFSKLCRARLAQARPSHAWPGMAWLAGLPPSTVTDFSESGVSRARDNSFLKSERLARTRRQFRCPENWVSTPHACNHAFGVGETPLFEKLAKSLGDGSRQPVRRAGCAATSATRQCFNNIFEKTRSACTRQYFCKMLKMRALI